MKNNNSVYLFETSYYKAAYIICAIVLLAITAVSIYIKKYFLLVFVVIFFILIKNGLKIMFSNDIANVKNKKRLLETGTKYDGIIIGYKKRALLEQLTNMKIDGIEKMDSSVYTLVVKFNDIEFETPAFIYNPESYLTTNKCTVYADEQGVYVSNFNSEKDDFKIEEIKDLVEE